MSDVIHLLPDTVANQIAAGEVVQRPASVVKELVENSIDAGASLVRVIIKDAGRTLVQVIDNGKGMSETDARLCFERHATSKISSADDLFSLHTMGFRGEALPSIASISQLELKTKRKEDEVGTMVEINGGNLERQESVACADGTSIAVKNIFYNVPARRKFLKSNSAEFGHIEREFFHIALANPQIEMELFHNDQLCYQLKPSGLKERIVGVFGKTFNTQLLSVDVDSTLVKIHGFIGKPESAKKQKDRQFFFVNGRFMRHPFFHKAIMQAYERLLQPGMIPDYFLFFEVNPADIDVNIHPTKTEIKFENDQTIWPILLAGVKESLGKFNVQPIDFDSGTCVYDTNQLDMYATAQAPKVDIDPTYNPFATSSSSYGGGSSSYSGGGSYKKTSTENWESLYTGFETSSSMRPTSMNLTPDDYSMGVPTQESAQQMNLDLEGEVNKTHYLQLKGKYILTVMRSGLYCIDQHRAHVRVLYDRYISNIQMQKGASQKLLFPIMIDVLESESLLLEELSEQLSYVGFDLANLGGGTFSINGIPSDMKESIAKEYLLSLLQGIRESGNLQEEMGERIALRLAEASAVPSGKMMTEEEMMQLVGQLFVSAEPDETPDRKPIMVLMSSDEIEKRFR